MLPPAEVKEVFIVHTNKKRMLDCEVTIRDDVYSSGNLQMDCCTSFGFKVWMSNMVEFILSLYKQNLSLLHKLNVAQ